MVKALIDLHEDISMHYVMGGFGSKFKIVDFTEDVKDSHANIPKFRKANVKIVFSAIAPFVPTIDPYRVEYLGRGYGHAIAIRSRAPMSMAIEHIKAYFNLARLYSKDIKQILTNDDVSKIPEDSRIGFLMSMEGAEPLEDVEDLEVYYQLGLRSLQLTWSFDSKYGATMMSKKDYGLTGDGEALVEYCNELGVIVDLAHGSKKATMEAMKMSKLPAIVSHANAMSVHKHNRNVDDEELDAIKRNHGVVGMSLIAPCISEKPSIRTLSDHIMYIRDNFGIENLAIGTDYFGLVNLDEPEGLEDITKFTGLWKELAERGLSQDEIEKVAYVNALRVIRANAARWRIRGGEQ